LRRNAGDSEWLPMYFSLLLLMKNRNSRIIIVESNESSLIFLIPTPTLSVFWLHLISYYAIINKMNKRHQRTLDAIYQIPVPTNLEWRRIEALFISLGVRVVEGRGSRIRFEMHNKVATFHRPHPGKEAKPYQVRDARRFLELLGISQ